MTDFQRLMEEPGDPLPGSGGLPAAMTHDSGQEAHGAVAGFVRASHAALARELICRIHAHPPAFFERVVIDVLLAMGYGRNRAEMTRLLGRSGDGGVDGVIALDELGLDLVYMQAKRLKPGMPVPVAEVRDFAGSLEARHAAKGVFVATTHFTPAAVDFCSRLSRRVVLVDGERLSELMMRFNIGVRVQHSLELKGIDRAYFVRQALRE